MAKKKKKNKTTIEKGRCWTQAGPLLSLFQRLLKKTSLFIRRSTCQHLGWIHRDVKLTSTTKALNYSSSPCDRLGGALTSPTKTIILKYNISICKYIYWNIQPLTSIYFNIQNQICEKKLYTVRRGDEVVSWPMGHNWPLNIGKEK